MQVQEYLQVNEKELRTIARQQGADKVAAVAALIKGRNFMARLNAEAQRPRSAAPAPVLPDPQGRLPEQVHEQDTLVRPMPTCRIAFQREQRHYGLPCYRPQFSCPPSAARGAAFPIGPPAHSTILHLVARTSTPAGVQGSQAFARRLGWHMDAAGDAGEVDADACVERIEALFRRAEYYAQGKRAERETGKTFCADWAALQQEHPAQAELAQLMVRPPPVASPALCLSLPARLALPSVCHRSRSAAGNASAGAGECQGGSQARVARCGGRGRAALHGGAALAHDTARARRVPG